MAEPAPIADAQSVDRIPQGFFDPEVGGFAGALGPILRSDQCEQVVSGFIVDARHCNPYGVCHGGWLSTFADVSMTRMASTGEGRWVTSNLSVDFIKPVPLGVWVQSDCMRLRHGERACLVQGVAHVGGEVVLRMNATFRRIG
jgi:uncharacterized protein (TIGR00369 family)